MATDPLMRSPEPRVPKTPQEAAAELDEWRARAFRDARYEFANTPAIDLVDIENGEGPEFVKKALAACGNHEFDRVWAHLRKRATGWIPTPFEEAKTPLDKLIDAHLWRPGEAGWRDPKQTDDERRERERRQRKSHA